MEILKVKHVTESNGVKVIVYSKPGFGKTYSISTIPNQKKVLVASAEQGLLTLRELCPDLDTVTIENMEDMRTLHANIDEDGPWYKKYDTLVVDSLTEVAEIMLSEEKDKTKDGRQAYGNLNDKMLMMVRSFKCLPMNVIFLCHQMQIQDDDNEIYYAPAFPGKTLYQKIPHQVDLLFALRIKTVDDEIQRAFLCNPVDEDYTAKSRGGSLNNFEPADWSVIFEKINGGN